MWQSKGQNDNFWIETVAVNGASMVFYQYMFTEISVQSFKSILQFAMHWLHENANMENFDVLKSTLKIAPMKKKSIDPSFWATSQDLNFTVRERLKREFKKECWVLDGDLKSVEFGS